MNRKALLVLFAILSVAQILTAQLWSPPSIVTVTASSTLPDAKKPGHYAVDKVYDGDPRSAWVEGKDDDGIGEWIEFSMEPPVAASEFRIMPGYFVSGVWKENNRVKAAAIEVTDDTGAKFTLPATFTDTMGQQRIYGLPGGYRRISRLRLTITDVYRGTKYRDTAISDFGFYDASGRKPLWSAPISGPYSLSGRGVGIEGPTQSGSPYGWANFYCDGFWAYSWHSAASLASSGDEIGVWSEKADGTATVTILFRRGFEDGIWKTMNEIHITSLSELSDKPVAWLFDGKRGDFPNAK
ncbi:MAG: hypothetical protein WCL50_04280 [Spirochaetota bacterium]